MPTPRWRSADLPALPLHAQRNQPGRQHDQRCGFGGGSEFKIGTKKTRPSRECSGRIGKRRTSSECRDIKGDLRRRREPRWTSWEQDRVITRGKNRTDEVRPSREFDWSDRGVSELGVQRIGRAGLNGGRSEQVP